MLRNVHHVSCWFQDVRKLSCQCVAAGVKVSIGLYPTLDSGDSKQEESNVCLCAIRITYFGW